MIDENESEKNEETPFKIKIDFAADNKFIPQNYKLTYHDSHTK